MSQEGIYILVAIFGALAVIGIVLWVIRILNQPVWAAIAVGVLGWLLFFAQLLENTPEGG
jgi:hypothetical protein